MNDFTVLYAYHPYRRQHARRYSIEALAEIERYFGGHVAHVVCNRDTDYAEGVRNHWNVPGSLIICEQDMAPLPEMIEDLVSCPHPACTQPYWLSPASTGFGHPIPSVTAEKDGTGTPLQPGDAWAGRSAVGLVKLGPVIRQGKSVPAGTFYGNVEHAVNTVVGWRWHVHWPMVTHYHGFQESDYERDRHYLEVWRLSRQRQIVQATGSGVMR